MYVKLQVTITVIAEADNIEALKSKVSAMDLSDIAYEINDGEWIGSVVLIGEGTEIPADKIAEECEAIGAPADFFVE